MVDLNAAVERLIDERVRKAMASHRCACSPAGSPPRTAYTVREVATSLGISTRQTYRLLGSGELRSKVIGGRKVVLVDDLHAFVAMR